MSSTGQSGQDNPSFLVRNLGTITGITGMIVGFVSIAFNILNYSETTRNNDTNARNNEESRKMAFDALTLSHQNYDRTSGKVAAKFNIIQSLPIAQTLPKAYWTSIMARPTFILRTPETAAKLAPRMKVQNAGEEPIEEFRVDAELCSMACIEDASNRENPNKWRWFRHELITRFHREVPPISVNIDTKEVAFVPFGREIVSSLMKADVKGREDKEHFAQIRVTVAGRLVQSTRFVPSQQVINKIKHEYVYYIWTPKDINESACKEFLDKYNRNVTSFSDPEILLPLIPMPDDPKK